MIALLADFKLDSNTKDFFVNKDDKIMKKIINGRKYDTETAKEVGCWSNGYPCSDFNHCKETLYLKKTGEYFLYGEGGALTQYARSVFGGTTGGSRIIPMTEESAKEWTMEHLECDECEALFGEVEE